MLVRTFGSTVCGVDAMTITIEVNYGPAFGYVLVGLPDSAVRESKERIFTSIRNNGLKVPPGKITVNMAPADLKKEGTAYDLPIALGILASSGQLKVEALSSILVMGELALDGDLRPVKGVLPIAIQARKDGFRQLLVPAQNAGEAGIIRGIDVIPLKNLGEAVAFLNGSLEIEPITQDARELFFEAQKNFELDFSDVRGQENIKRSLEISAAGGHNVLLLGPPGAGKTMLARRMPGILPPLTLHEALETTKIHSVAGKLGKNGGLIAHRAFRSPHHTVSYAAMAGGGGIPQPGEISLAHNGVLFLDELPEFSRSVLEVLRQPLEERQVTVSRSRVSVNYPANFMLVAAMNPCPCGYYNHPAQECICSPHQINRYMGRISGPLIDRIDLHIEVTPVEFEQLGEGRTSESSAEIRGRVIAARERQKIRFEDHPGVYHNAMMPTSLARQVCRIDSSGRRLLKVAMERLGLSARAFERILKVSRTIADLQGSPEIETMHLAEAIQYRSLDRANWGA